MADVYATAARPARAARRPAAARALAHVDTRASSRSRGCLTGGTVLDVGCGVLGLRAQEPGARRSPASTCAERPDYPGPFVRADPAEGLPFADDVFDLVYCSSVIEHVPPARRAAFAAELRRVGRGWFVQTPALRLPARAALAAARRPLAAAALASARTGAWA